MAKTYLIKMKSCSLIVVLILFLSCAVHEANGRPGENTGQVPWPPYQDTPAFRQGSTVNATDVPRTLGYPVLDIDYYIQSYDEGRWNSWTCHKGEQAYFHVYIKTETEYGSAYLPDTIWVRSLGYTDFGGHWNSALNQYIVFSPASKSFMPNESTWGWYNFSVTPGTTAPPGIYKVDIAIGHYVLGVPYVDSRGYAYIVVSDLPSSQTSSQLRPDLQFKYTGTPATINPNGTFTCTITLQNAGNENGSTASDSSNGIQVYLENATFDSVGANDFKTHAAFGYSGSALPSDTGARIIEFYTPSFPHGGQKSLTVTVRADNLSSDEVRIKLTMWSADPFEILYNPISQSTEPIFIRGIGYATSQNTWTSSTFQSYPYGLQIPFNNENLDFRAPAKTSEPIVKIPITVPNNPPNQPSNILPADGAPNQSLTPTLQGNAFSDSDAGDTHAASEWQVLNSTGTSIVWDSYEDSVNKTSCTVPQGNLTYSMTYKWQVRYKDNHNANTWSIYSPATSFTTQAAPNNRPNTPNHILPADGAPNQSLTPTLQGSAFSDPDAGDTHTASQWIVALLDGSVVYNSYEDAPATSKVVPSGKLGYLTTYQWTVYYKDSRGAWSDGCATTFTTLPQPPDTTPPTVVISSPTNGQAFTSSPITVSGTANDPGSPSSGVVLVEVRLNGGIWQTATGTNSWNCSVNLASGSNTIEARSRDNAGNYSNIASVTVTYSPPDTQGPAITITSPLNNATVTSASLPVSGTASDNGYGNNGISSVTVNGVSASGGTASGSGTANWSATITLNSGTNTITVIAKDSLNNQTTKQITVTYNPPDTQGPALTIISPLNNATVTSASLPVSGTASDSGYGNNGISSVTVNGVSASGGTASGANTANWNATITLSPGANTITVVVKDTLNNSSQKQITVTYNPPDTTNPSVTITIPTSNPTYSTTSSTIYLGGTASDNVGVTQVNWSNNQGGSGTAGWTTSWTDWITDWIGLQSGDNVITVTARDAAGNTGTDTITVTYTPPDMTPDPFTFIVQTGVALNTTVTSNTITVSGINSAASITITGGTYSINGGAYTSAAGTVNNGNTVTVRQASSGSYSSTTNATLTIGGVSGTFSVTTQSAPVDTTPPIVTITSPLNNATVTSESLTVIGTASDNGYGNNGISSVTVNGVSASGGTASGSGTANWNATITLSPGANTITVVAKDTLNNSSQKQITVTYTPPPTLVRIEISGSTQVSESSGNQYSCTAYYSDNSILNVTNIASWSQNSSYASISSTGYLTALPVSSDQICTITANYDGQQDTYDITIKNLLPSTGGLQVTLIPDQAVSDGAQWNVDGGNWHNSGEAVSDLTVGLHTVNYKTIPGWIAPESEQVTINNGQTTPIISPNYVQQSGNLLIKKCTVTAGKYINEDKITLSGTIDVNLAEFSAAGEITVNIGGVYEESIDTSLFTAKNGKFKYTYRIPGGGQGGITSLVLDTNKRTFSLKVRKVDLTGLHCPFDIEFEIGNYWGVCSVDETIVNGRRFIPVQLMAGVEDYLQVQSVKVKKGKSTDTLTAKGGIAYGIMPTSMSDVVLILEGQTFTIPAVNFKPSGKSGLKYVCKNAKISEGGIANGTFDFGKCTFSISIKNTKINSASGAVDLTLTIGSFNEQVNFDLGG